ncbi:MAG: esterase-like activity of phytase family protein [Oscillatoriophycideae cyanobacterium NC_groundwater_1537_Pr4_S-0.65um_50_18]|nr:esterase-like activity of phytase family protein [Oscillatoriophycideae cyanobacterium NC_groundwater_1537_Pr4_S-0.65um_50_18]
MNKLRQFFALDRPWLLILLAPLLLSLTGCNLPQVKAEDRLFLNLSVDFLDEYRLPKLTFEETPVGGLSGITYDRQRDRFYAISDDRSEKAPARFYTLKLSLQAAGSDGAMQIENLEIEKVTTLTAEDGLPYASGTIDAEGIAISPRQTLLISSEGVSRDGIPPFIDEFDLETGRWLSRLPIPQRFLPGTDQPVGVQDNLGFESLTLNASGSAGGQLEPFRVFSATESALQQDLPDAPDVSGVKPLPVRFLHYLVGDRQTTLLAEHLYLVEPALEGTTNGLTELLTLDQGGHFLSLERSYGELAGTNAHLFQLATGVATDITGVDTLKGDISRIAPIYKRSLLNLRDLNIPLDNLEGMAIGPRLADGSRSLLLISDDNFNPAQVTQLLLFRIRGIE